MSEPAKNPGQQPESYQPRKPEIITMAAQAQEDTKHMCMKNNRPEIITFQMRRDAFLFLGVEQAVTSGTDFGAVWETYFKTAESCGFGDYEYVIWYYKDGAQMYFVGKMADGADDVPEGFSLASFPACEYLAVTHEWLPTGENLYTDGILLTQNYVGIGQTHDYKENVPVPEGYVRYDGPDSPITQIEKETSNARGECRFERWVPIKKVD